MKMTKHITTSLLSLLIILMGAFIVYLITIFCQDKNQAGFSLSLLYIICFGAAFIAGIITIILQFLRVHTSGLSPILHFIGVSNLVFGIWGICTSLTHHTTDNGFLPYLAVSIIMGICILTKIYKAKEL